MALDPPKPRAVLSQQSECWDGEARLHAPTCWGQTHQSSEGGLGGTGQKGLVSTHEARALWPVDGGQAHLCSGRQAGAGTHSFPSRPSFQANTDGPRAACRDVRCMARMA